MLGNAEVHPSGYYAWLAEPACAREIDDRRLLGHIKRSWLESGSVYGYRKVHDDMRALGERCGKLVVDDFSGYKAGFKLGITEIGCMAHARRKFFDLHASNKSQIAEQVLKFFAELYDVEREAAELDPEQRQSIREERGRPIAQALHVWMLAQRKLVSEGSAIAKALDHNLKRCLVCSAQLNGHDPYVYLKDVLARLPTHRNSDVAELLPHRWKPDSS